MHLPHFAKRPMAALALSLVLAACGDSTAPDQPFDPAGTSADIEALAAAFNSPVMQSYDEAVGALSEIAGGGPSASIAAWPSTSLRSRFGAAEFAKRISARLEGVASSTKPSFAFGEYAGKTFVYDPELEHYVVSDTATGAPSNGVRLILYAVDPISGEIAEPLNAIGYVQLTATNSGTSSSARLKIVSGETTYLDYTVSQKIGSTSATIGVVGFATNGTDRAEFNISMQMTGDEESGFVTLKHSLKVPTRGFQLSATVTFDSETEETTMAFEARGAHGRVNVTGSVDDGVGGFDVKVNGEPFATITLTGETTVVVNANGEPLTEDEEDALGDIFDVFGNGFSILGILLAPTGLGIG